MVRREKISANIVVHTEKHKAPNNRLARLLVRYDEYAITPRDYDNLGSLLVVESVESWLAHSKRTHSFNAHDGDQYQDYLIDTNVDYATEVKDYARNLLQAQLGLSLEDVVIFPVIHMYHSTYTLQLGDLNVDNPYSIGFIFATKEKIKWELGVPEVTQEVLERVEKTFCAELEELEAWVNGQTFEYYIETFTLDDLGKEIDHETIDCCTGFIGDVEYCISDGRSSLAAYLGIKH